MRKIYFDKLVDIINEKDIDAMLISPSEELLFLLGTSPRLCERFQGLFIKNTGEYFYICNTLTADEMREALGPDVKVYDWFDGDYYTDIVRQALTDFDLVGKKIAVNSSAQVCNILEISKELSITFVAGKYLLEEIRIQKTDEELENLRKSSLITDKAFENLLNYIKPGMKEEEIKHVLLPEMYKQQGGKMVPGSGVVASGAGSSFPHYNDTQRIIQEKDILILDIAGVYNGMRSDMTRTIFFGEVSEEERKIYNLVLKANLAGEKAAVEGAFIPNVDKAARDVIEQAGYGKYFTTRLGHGIGYMGHEAPDIKGSNPRYLEKRMAFTIEPGIYLTGKFGVRIEDTLIITENGTEILNNATKDIVVL